MKAGARYFTLTFLIALLAFRLTAQDCNILNFDSQFTKSDFCSPVDVSSWNVLFIGVNDAGTPVQIRFDWDDGDVVTLPATEGPDGTFSANSSHTYNSEDDRCVYSPRATAIVNGEVCEDAAIQTDVVVWDTDDENGGNVEASPDVYPVCFGNGATMRFRDNTRFNCVPPQEDDNVNHYTRWVQFVYGTNHLSSKFMPATVDGSVRAWPYEGPVVELPTEVTGSNLRSLFIGVDDTHDIGDEFEVELRYWNICNPYPGPYETDRSRIRIVDYPDATIDPVDPLCQFGNEVTLSAATGGGTWNGPGIVDTNGGIFSPAEAGSGTHIIQYDITQNTCTATDTVAILVVDAPNATIFPPDPLCIYQTPYDLEAAASDGTWEGPGITDANTGLFDPSEAGPGRHEVSFTTLPDLDGCIGTDTAEIVVVDIPDAAFLTPDSAWCEKEDNNSTADILISGTDSTNFDLIISHNGIPDTLRNLPPGVYTYDLHNQPGQNTYQLLKVFENHGSNSCEKSLVDILVNQVNPKPDLFLNVNYDTVCSPIQVEFSSAEGYNLYSWDFGDGTSFITSSSNASHTYTFNYEDHIIAGADTISNDSLKFSRHDTTYHLSLYVETINGCSDSLAADIAVYPTPEAQFIAAPDILNYPDSVINLTNTSSPGAWNYSWIFGDLETSEEKDPGSHAYESYGIYEILLRVSGLYCQDTAKRQIQILPPPAIALFEPDTVGCPPLVVNFANSSLYADTYIWDFDDGTFSAEPNPTHVFYDNREHTVTMAAIGLTGTDTIEKIVSVYTPPQAIFDVFPKEARNLKQVFKFSNNTINGDYYLWDFGDGNTSPAMEPSHIYGEEGIFTVTLYAWSENDCPDTAIQKNLITIVAGEGSADFPTAFVFDPSSKGGYWQELPPEKINTVFRPVVVNVKEFRMEIYTRWGEKIFETNDLSVGWDGYMRNDQVAKEGVYLWKAWVKYVDNTEDILAGDITFFH